MENAKKRMGGWMVFAKNLLRTWLDNHVLAGTVTGTEILWVYLVNWKREVALIFTACLSMRSNRHHESDYKPTYERVVSNCSQADLTDEQCAG